MLKQYDTLVHEVLEDIFEITKSNNEQLDEIVKKISKMMGCESDDIKNCVKFLEDKSAEKKVKISGGPALFLNNPTI